jgi:hypothetical protein
MSGHVAENNCHLRKHLPLKRLIINKTFCLLSILQKPMSSFVGAGSVWVIMQLSSTEITFHPSRRLRPNKNSSSHLLMQVALYHRCGGVIEGGDRASWVLLRIRGPLRPKPLPQMSFRWHLLLLLLLLLQI